MTIILVHIYCTTTEKVHISHIMWLYTPTSVALALWGVLIIYKFISAHAVDHES